MLFTSRIATWFLQFLSLYWYSEFAMTLFSYLHFFKTVVFFRFFYYIYNGYFEVCGFFFPPIESNIWSLSQFLLLPFCIGWAIHSTFFFFAYFLMFGWELNILDNTLQHQWVLDFPSRTCYLLIYLFNDW